jgi:hypothetical protein
MRAMRTMLVAGDRLGLADRLHASGADVLSVPGPFTSRAATRAAFAAAGPASAHDRAKVWPKELFLNWSKDQYKDQ